MVSYFGSFIGNLDFVSGLGADGYLLAITAILLFAVSALNLYLLYKLKLYAEFESKVTDWAKIQVAVVELVVNEIEKADEERRILEMELKEVGLDAKAMLDEGRRSHVAR